MVTLPRTWRRRKKEHQAYASYTKPFRLQKINNRVQYECSESAWYVSQMRKLWACHANTTPQAQAELRCHQSCCANRAHDPTLASGIACSIRLEHVRSAMYIGNVVFLIAMLHCRTCLPINFLGSVQRCLHVPTIRASLTFLGIACYSGYLKAMLTRSVTSRKVGSTSSPFSS